ncbi:MAG: hypothetical protein AAF677_16835 [Pseudomonadota bacterium]
MRPLPRLTITLVAALATASVVAAPALAQEAEDPDRAALAAALAEVNEPNDRPSLLSPRGNGFFGSGFTVSTDSAFTGVGGARFGLRDSDVNKRRVQGVRLYTR